MNHKARFAKIAISTPLALGLLLGTVSCGVEANEGTQPTNEGIKTSTDENKKMSPEVEKNIERTMEATIDWREANGQYTIDWVDARDEGKNFDATSPAAKEMVGLIANDAGLDKVKTKMAKESKTKLSDSNLTILAKGDTAIWFGEYYDGSMNVDINPEGFEKIDGNWFQTKEGAVAFTDKDGRYTNFGDNGGLLSFTEDGQQVTLTEVPGDNAINRYVVTDNALQFALMIAERDTEFWISENEPKSMSADIAPLQDKIFKGTEKYEDIEVELKGTLNKFKVIVKNSKTGTMMSVYGSESEHTQTGPKNKKMKEYELFEEYMETTNLELPKKDPLKWVVDTMNKNESNKDATWSSIGEGENGTAIATIDGVEYKFSNFA